MPDAMASRQGTPSGSAGLDLLGPLPISAKVSAQIQDRLIRRMVELGMLKLTLTR